ncbi:MAG TPA: hypothetical protein DDW52_10195 [Planctomycetaceae bacterium]|nr:hypothetical protein [Planctomycetaceae bacterium]
MSLLQNAEAYLREVRRQHLAQLVTYQRGADSVDLLATQGSTDTENDSGAVVVQSRSIDWILEAADLLLNETEVLPEKGDRIVVGSRIYEVVDLGGEPCFRWHGRDSLSLRVHTKEVIHVAAD